jgi:hypothetical protein
MGIYLDLCGHELLVISFVGVVSRLVTVAQIIEALFVSVTTNKKVYTIELMN